LKFRAKNILVKSWEKIFLSNFGQILGKMFWSNIGNVGNFDQQFWFCQLLVKYWEKSYGQILGNQIFG